MKAKSVKVTLSNELQTLRTFTPISHIGKYQKMHANGNEICHHLHARIQVIFRGERRGSVFLLCEFNKFKFSEGGGGRRPPSKPAHPRINNITVPE